jgi:hypothetical protein
MNVTPEALQSAAELERLSDSCLAYLASEETLLTGLLDSLRTMRATIAATDLAGLRDCFREQETLIAEKDRLANQRDRLRQELARCLGVRPEAASITRLADRASSTAKPALVIRRNCVRALAAQVNDCNHATATLVSYNLDFLEQVLGTLTGSAGKRYSPAGKVHEPGSGAILSLQG